MNYFAVALENKEKYVVFSQMVYLGHVQAEDNSATLSSQP